ncbi:MAG: hypothetical protein WD225_15465 [Ilumatobacteraceae bacterium]
MTPNPTRTHRTRRIAGLMVSGALLTAACGGDDDALSDDEFCERMEQVEEEFEEDPDDELDAEDLNRLADLATSAPNDEIRDALNTFGEFAERLEGVDEDDPEAFGEAMSIVFDPEFTSAFESLEEYLVGTCGYDESEFSGGFDDEVVDEGSNGGDTTGADDAEPDIADDAEPDIAYDEVAYDEVFDDLSLLRDPVEAELGSVQGVGIMSMMGAPIATIDIDPAEVDPMEACEVLATIWDDLLSASGLPVEINDADFELVVSRPAGGDCTPE